MQEQAEKFKERDLKVREMSDLRNEADSQTYAAEKSLKEYKSKLPENLVKDIEEKVRAVRLVTSMGEPKAEDLKKALSELKETVMKIGGAMSNQQNEQTSQKQENTNDKAKDDKAKDDKSKETEAEYEETKK
ncbi:hypothetical protein MHBO_004853 [Bonamia ostreae]|uniref:Chaperone protein DnaK n=1 Tax=Bonamia ostreae TaxID=126728 RepID=A0ABV2AUG2_9EUKA